MVENIDKLKEEKLEEKTKILFLTRLESDEINNFQQKNKNFELKRLEKKTEKLYQEINQKIAEFYQNSHRLLKAVKEKDDRKLDAYNRELQIMFGHLSLNLNLAQEFVKSDNLFLNPDIIINNFVVEENFNLDSSCCTKEHEENYIV